MATRRGIVRRMREMSSGRREALVCGALALLALIVLVPHATAGRVPSEDTGVFTYVARLIGEGGLPYRDAWDHKPPGVYLIDAVALAVAGLWGLWAAEVVALALAAILSYRALANTGLGGAAALAGTFAWLVALPRLFLEDGVQTNFSELFALPLQLAALDLFAREEARPRPTWRTAAIATLGGSARLLKPTHVATLIAIPLTLAVTHVRPRPDVVHAWREVFLAVRAASAAPRVVIEAGVVVAKLPGVVVARLALEGDDGIARAAAAYVGANTRPGETVLVWGSRSEVLVLAERRSATRFVYQYAGRATRGYAAAEEVAALLDDLERSRPVLVVDASRDSFVTPPLDRSALATWLSPEPQYRWPPETARVVAWLESGYDRVATLGSGWPVWRRRAPQRRPGAS